MIYEPRNMKIPKDRVEKIVVRAVGFPVDIFPLMTMGVECSRDGKGRSALLVRDRYNPSVIGLYDGETVGGYVFYRPFSDETREKILSYLDGK
jgi:hypothetical protein